MHIKNFKAILTNYITVYHVLKAQMSLAIILHIHVHVRVHVPYVHVCTGY